MDFKEKRNLNRVLYSKFTIVVLSLVLIFLLTAVWDVYRKAKIAYSGKYETQHKLEGLAKRETALLIGIEKLKTKRGIESEIRKKFGVVKEGEELVVVMEKNQEESDMNVSKNKDSNFFRKVINFF